MRLDCILHVATITSYSSRCYQMSLFTYMVELWVGVGQSLARRFRYRQLGVSCILRPDKSTDIKRRIVIKWLAFDQTIFVFPRSRNGRRRQLLITLRHCQTPLPSTIWPTSKHHQHEYEQTSPNFWSRERCKYSLSVRVTNGFCLSAGVNRFRFSIAD